jgi:exosome complex exonuclease RRP6
MQLSTRSADWLVDTLALRDDLGPCLAPLLADPGVVKVLHGADHDILWLQVSSWLQTTFC